MPAERSIDPSARASPEPEVVDPSPSADHAQTILFRPPFRVSDGGSAGSASGDGFQTSNIRQARSSAQSSPLANVFAASTPSSQPEVIMNALPITAGMDAQSEALLSTLQAPPISSFSITPGLFDADVPTDSMVWANLFGEFASSTATTSFDCLNWSLETALLDVDGAGDMS